MVSFFSHQNYRELLKHGLEHGKRFNPGLTAQKLAEAAGVQKSYLSKVFNQRADLSSDQLYRIGQYLEWSDEQLEFALKLLEYERSGLHARKKKMREEIEHLQQKHLAIKEVLQAPTIADSQEFLQDYYLNPWVQVVHIGLAIPRYASNLRQLANDLRVPEAVVLEAVKLLLKRNIVREKKDKSLEVLVKQIHLAKDSPVFKAWQSQLRLMALQRLQTAPRKTDYSFNVVFSADESARKRLQGEILELLKKAEAQVKDAADKEIYFLGLDYFQWTE